jgi:hypothetical protein
MSTEYERIREQLADWLLQNINQGCGFKEMTFGEAATEILKFSGIEIKSDDQSLPLSGPYNLGEATSVRAAREDMLKQNWIKVIPKK